MARDDEEDRPRKRPRDEDDEIDDRPKKRRRDEDDDLDDDRPRKRRRDEDDYDNDDRPRRRRRDDDDYDDDDDRPQRKKKRLPAADLRAIATYQKGLLLSILALLLLGAVIGFATTGAPKAGFYVQIASAIPGLAAFGFCVMLANKVYNSAVATVVIALLCLIPCINLITWFVVSSKATSILKANGIPVGFMGASNSDLP